jgi:hypothetical protein
MWSLAPPALRDCPRHRVLARCFVAVRMRHTPAAVRRADLFSRETRPGFEGWGEEHGKFDDAGARAPGSTSDHTPLADPCCDSNVWTMAEALKKAIDALAAAPRPFAFAGSAVPGVAQRQDILRNVRKFESDVAEWRTGMLGVQGTLTTMYRQLSELPPPGNTLPSLDELIDQVERETEAEALAIEQGNLIGRQTVAALAKTSSDNAQFAKKVLKRLREAGIAQHNARLKFLDFLVTLRADYDPDYRGGATFENAEDLIADLRNKTH